MKIVNVFIENDSSDWDHQEYQSIYTIGVYSKLESEHRIFYAGETSGKRDFVYPPKVIDCFGMYAHSARVPQILFKEGTVEKKLIELGDKNPFETIDLKTFRCIIESMYIELFNIPKEFNIQRRDFSRNLLNAGYVLHLLSRKYRYIPKCLDIMSKLNIYDFDYISKKFIIEDTDLPETVKLKNEINKISEDTIKFISENKYLSQGGYQYSDCIYSNDVVDIVSKPSKTISSLEYSFKDHLWNKGKDCLCLYQDYYGRYLIVIDPSESGLSVDIGEWINKYKDLLKIDEEVVNSIKEELISLT
jgi:hypothetical protein